MKTKPDAIIVGDIHYRDDQPICRTDDFWETQKRKAQWLCDLWERLDRPMVLQPGDVFHRWKSSPQVIRAVLEYLPPMVTIPGNHDLPAHNLELYDKSALAVVGKAGNGWTILMGGVLELPKPFPIIVPFPWGDEPYNPRGEDKLRRAMLAHTMIVKDPQPFEGEQAHAYLRRMVGYDLIVTGHNHQQIVAQRGDRLLVNPGGFTRQTADEAEHKPHVFLWYAEKNRLEPVPIPIEPNVVTREHLATKELRDERIAAFVESLVEEEIEIGVNFLENVMRALESNKVREMVRQRVMEALECALKINY